MACEPSPLPLLESGTVDLAQFGDKMKLEMRRMEMEKARDMRNLDLEAEPKANRVKVEKSR
ncbi:hypothetical protein E2C01_071502 [Portunus trituberculatus]|uniref:Uncharacterized protein n=1 Tax=Portunus trituberculatus TaxID=210409 RepID=A0A5B7I5A1_PORTR|nr:hypothetical protein [Portunus trituberculatus]